MALKGGDGGAAYGEGRIQTKWVGDPGRAPGLDRRDVGGFPSLGFPNLGRGSLKSPSRQLSTVGIQGRSRPRVFEEINRGITLLPKETLQVHRDRLKREMSVVPRTVAMPPSVISGPVAKVAGPQSKGVNMGLDLGNLLNTGLDLFARYKNIQDPRPVMAPVAAPAARITNPANYDWEQGMAGPTFISDPGGGLPGIDIIAEPPAEAIAAGMKGWAYKKSCGEWKWVKSGNRRRRKLLTDSDYNGLLKLQTLKVNSNMNIAIAKSIGR